MSTEGMVAVQEIYLKSDPESGFMVILKENRETNRYFIMFVGEAEYTAIAKEKGLIEPIRPLTHDLYLSVIKNAPLEFLRVHIHGIRENTFLAQVLFRVDGEQFSVDSRPSDAVALALNRKIPIMVNRELFHRELTREEAREYDDLIKTVKF